MHRTRRTDRRQCSIAGQTRTPCTRYLSDQTTTYILVTPLTKASTLISIVSALVPLALQPLCPIEVAANPSQEIAQLPCLVETPT